MTRPIGYYVHHQGAGHRQRARVIAAALRTPCVLIGTFGEAADEMRGLDLVDLPDDRPDGAGGFTGADGAANRPEAFHYAPIGHPGVRRRMAMLAAWIETHDLSLMIVDVSVEIALFARLMGVKTVVVRLTGARTDIPHLEAFRGAALVLAPFPRLFESPDTPRWVRDKTFYGGLLAPPVPSRSHTGRIARVAVVLGRGGAGGDSAMFERAARATPDVDWHVYGPLPASGGIMPNLRIHGWQRSVEAAIDAADVVVGGAGDGLLAEVAARAKRFICLPEARPFHEQRDKGEALAAHRMAVVLDAWPDAEAWPAVLRRAETLDPTRLHALVDPRAIPAVAAKLDDLASYS